MKIQIIHKNYPQLLDNYQLKLPIDLEIFIPEDDSVRLLSLMMEELDYKKLYEAYSPNGRNPAVPPKILFQILVYAYMNDIWSSRKIELACKRDINFMWLLQGFKAPDHNTIARFRTGRLEPILDDLFNQFIIKLYENNELELKNLFIDGTKIEANANKYTFVWKKSVSKNEINLGEDIKLFIKNINDKFNKNFSIVENTVKSKLLREVLEFLNVIKLSLNINKDKNIPYIINKIRNNGKRIFIIVSPVIKEEELKNYNEKSLVKTNEGYITDITDEQNIRTYANYLRKIFDLNPDGIYVEESNIKTINGNLKNILFYENLHNLINKIKKEYTEKYIIFNKLNTTEKVKQKETEEKNNNSLIFSYKNQINIEKEIYSINYESIKKKENMYINSFLFSGYKAYFYECNKDEIEELTKQGKLQLIIKEENKSKNKCFPTKRLKNKQYK